MSALQNSDENKFTVVCPIKCIEKDGWLEISTFISKPLDYTLWNLEVYYERLAGVGYFIDAALERPRTCSGPKVVALNFEIRILYEDKMLFSGKGECDFTKGCRESCNKLEHSDIYIPENNENRFANYVTICCQMWTKNELPESGHCLILPGNAGYSVTELMSSILKYLNIPLGKNQKNDSTPGNIDSVSSSTRSLQMDLEHLYNKQLLCDKKLRTVTKVFPVHNSILSARSPVFERMFSSDMREKSSDEVGIADLEDDTVHRMLLFLYTDSVENLDLESANKLYYAADKYEIDLLKSICVSYLSKNVSVSDVCEVLLLADMHRDEKLKSTGTNFVLDHYKDVMRSEQWSLFVKQHVHMAAEIMHFHGLQ